MLAVSDFDWKRFSVKSGAMTTIAYWILAPKAGTRVSSFTAGDLHYRLSSQCDTEDQACVGDDDCVGDPDFFNPCFRPIAPVQFALQWSPLPFLSALLGVPSHFSVDDRYQGCVLAAWPRRSLQPAAGVGFFSSRVQKFERRAYELVTAAFVESDEVGVVATPGWSYASRRLPKIVRAALRTHGFRFDTRAP
jgi:hypothetical protein